MHPVIPIAFAFLLFLSCNGVGTAGVNTFSQQENVKPMQKSIEAYEANYASLKKSIAIQQAALSKGGRKGKIAAKDYIYHAMYDSLFSYWYGTPWDYNGVTQSPRQGKIACGYFVTTLLRDAGFDVARVRLAQAAASTLINTVCATSTIKRYSTLKDLEGYMATVPAQSLLILGLDNHVGFVVKDSAGCWFIHASCVGARAVEKQALADAEPIVQSKSYMIGNVLANDRLIARWLH